MDIDALPLKGCGGLVDVLNFIPDPRCRSVRFPGKALLATALCAMLNGHKSFQAIAEWIADQPAETRKALGFKRKEAPSEKTIRTFLQRLDAQTFSQRMGAWFEDLLKTPADDVVAIDGKVLRGSLDHLQAAVQLVSVVSHRQGITLAQQQVIQGDEIGTAKRCLSNMNLFGKTVTMDALHTQRETADLIVTKKGHYVMTVKDNQPGLREEIANAPFGAFSPSVRADKQRPRSRRRTKN